MKSKYWPEDNTVPPSVAHRGDWQAERFYPNGATGAIPWTAGRAPDLNCGHNMYTTGRLRSCGYCGSMHPADLAAAIKAGARVSWADRKYGWPHKVYAEGVPNPYAGLSNSTTSCGHGNKLGEKDSHAREYIERSGGEWVQLRSSMDDQKKDEFASYPWHKVGTEGATRYEKFYTLHLQDATPEERKVIEQAMHLQFDFHADGRIRWRSAMAGDAPWPAWEDKKEAQS